MKLLILLVIVIVCAILTVQNLQVVPLYFLGNSAKTAILTLTLPLGVWVICSTLAGLLTSLVIRGFLRSPRPAAANWQGKPQRSSGSASRSSVSPPAKPINEPINSVRSPWAAQAEADWNDAEAVENWFDEEDLAQPAAGQSDRQDAPSGLDWQTDLRREFVNQEPQVESEEWESRDIYDQPSFEKQRKVEENRWDRERQEAELEQLEREEQQKEERIKYLTQEQQRALEIRQFERESQGQTQRVIRESIQERQTRQLEREPIEQEPFEREPIERQPRLEDLKSRSQQRPEVSPPTEGISIFPSRSNFEAPQTPKTSTQEGTIYTYTYKEPRDRQKAPSPESKQLSEKKPEAVFDVNYRLITPPSSPNSQDDDDEEWI
jgi:hypothetical protein